MIRYTTPYALDRNLARAYNYEIEISDGYVAFVDRDTIWLRADFGKQIAECIRRNGLGYYTCLTNRTNCAWQRHEHKGNDIAEHIKVADKLYALNEYEVREHTEDQLWSGHLMVCPTEAWVPLEERQNLLGVDNEIHKNAQFLGVPVYLMTGVYMYHYYSNFDGSGGHQQRDKSHLW